MGWISREGERSISKGRSNCVGKKQITDPRTKPIRADSGDDQKLDVCLICTAALCLSRDS